MLGGDCGEGLAGQSATEGRGETVSGVCAVLARSRRPLEEQLIDVMVAAAPHRATGGMGRYRDASAAVAELTRSRARRGGAGPAVDTATGVMVVADARIDNFDELRQALRTAPTDHASPAALLSAAYRRWGAAFLARVIGDFAVIVWDPGCRQLLLARDPMGMRSLYYRVEPERVLIATELAQLLAVPGVPDEPDERMAAAYLAGCFGALDWTYYQGISQVAPAHAVVIDADGAVPVRAQRYWDIDPGHRITHRSERDYAEHLRELYLGAVRARLVGDRPVGVFLSGGVDSGAVASTAGWLLERDRLAPRFHAYLWDFGAFTQCDERHISRHIIERYPMDATDVPVDDAGPLSGYPEHAPDLDDPFHGHFQTMLDRGFACAQNDGVGPLFTGMRGDLAAGPIDVDYQVLLRRRQWAALAGELRRHAHVTGEALGTLAQRRLLPGVRKALRRRSAAYWARRVTRQGRPRSPGSYPDWINADFARRVDLAGMLAEYTEVATPPLDGPFRRRRYQWVFMPMHLRWATSHERRAARFGIEAVDAWSDRRIAEFCIAVPQQVLDSTCTLDKRLVREAMRGLMPEAFRLTARKIVPTPVFVEALRGVAVPHVRHLLTESRAEAAGWVDAASLRGHFERFLTGGPLARELWWALSLEWWLRVREQARGSA